MTPTPAPLPFQTITVRSTANFTVLYENIDRGGNLGYSAGELAVVQQRAEAILDACEANYTTLCQWFGLAVGQGFGATNRIRVTLTTLSPWGGVLGGAYNHKYGHPAQIFANPYSARSSPSDDEVVVAAVVAELAEIMMSLQGQDLNGNWDGGNSSGEGLSRVAAQLLHPVFVTSFFDPAPNDIQFWLESLPTDNQGWFAPTGPKPLTLSSHTSVRQDWVSRNFTGEDGVPGDGDWFSFGCAILFIYYLKDQLGFGMDQIAQSKGSTLEGRYQSLTGRTDGFMPFKAVLDAFYPRDSAPLPTLTYDLFPLGGTHCRVAVTTGLVRHSSPATVRTASALQGTMCGPRQFSYTLYNLDDHLTVTAQAFGFGHPVFNWSINGQTFPASGGDTALTVSAIVVPVDPEASVAPRIEEVSIRVTGGNPFGAQTTSSEIDVQIFDNPGQVQLRFDVMVTDEFAPASEGAATSFSTPVLETQQVVWDPAYQRAVEECWNRYRATHNRPLPYLRTYMPDPPPDLLAAAEVLERLRREVEEVAAQNPELAREINQSFGGVLLFSARRAPEQ